MRRLEFKVGDRRNRWTYIGEAESRIGGNGQKLRYILCRCDCGTVRELIPSEFARGHTKSGGCWKNEQTALRQRKYNTYETDGEVTKIYDGKGNVALIDTEDLEKVKPYFFCMRKKEYSNGGYWYTRSKHLPDVITLLHRFLVDCPSGYMVDHINHNRSDNRKCNLAIVTPLENMRNYPAIGIVFLEKINKWQISIRNKDTGEIDYLGTYDTFEKALDAYKPYINN